VGCPTTPVGWALLLRSVVATIPPENEGRLTILHSLELVGAKVLMLLAIGHDDRKLLCLGSHGFPIPVQGTADQDRLLQKIAVRAGGHQAILTPVHLVLNALSPNTG